MFKRLFAKVKVGVKHSHFPMTPATVTLLRTVEAIAALLFAAGLIAFRYYPVLVGCGWTLNVGARSLTDGKPGSTRSCSVLTLAISPTAPPRSLLRTYDC